jgi:hypothetical protein
MDPALSPLLDLFVKQGILGAVVGGLSFAVGALWRELRSTSNARVADSAAFQDRLVAILDKINETARDTNATLAVMREKVGSK